MLPQHRPQQSGSVFAIDTPARSIRPGRNAHPGRPRPDVLVEIRPAISHR